MRSALVCLAVAASAVGCASAPTGRSEYQRLSALEQKTMSGGYPWSSFYREAVGVIDAMEPDPFLFELRAHYAEMLTYSTAMDSGKITFDEFALLQRRQFADALARLNRIPKPATRLRGETQEASGDWLAPLVTLGAIVGGAAAGASMSRPRQTNCTSSAVGRTVQTTCY
jgi:hypothetical protein